MNVIHIKSPVVHQVDLLRVMLHIREWESSEQAVVKTRAERDLYLRLAAGLIAGDGKPQTLKNLQGHLSERATRQCIRKFEVLGLIEIHPSQSDLRTKRAIPTEKFVRHLNQHLDFLMQLCEQEFVMIHKD